MCSVRSGIARSRRPSSMHVPRQACEALAAFLRVFTRLRPCKSSATVSPSRRPFVSRLVTRRNTCAMKSRLFSWSRTRCEFDDGTIALRNAVSDGAAGVGASEYRVDVGVCAMPISLTLIQRATFRAHEPRVRAHLSSEDERALPWRAQMPGRIAEQRDTRS